MHEPARKRRYRTPPIEEAVVEFRFEPGQEWDPTIPGKLHSHPDLHGVYSGKPREQRVIQAALSGGSDQTANLSVVGGVARVQLLDQEGRRLVSVGPDVLGVSDLRPYSGWGQFRPRIEAALSAYATIAHASRMVRLGVRYINKIVLPESAMDLGNYFHCGPPRIDGLPNTIGAFLNRTQYAFDEAVKLLLTFANVEEPSGDRPAFVLDLDVSWEGAESLPIGVAMSQVELLHEREGTAFEATITDATREVFDGL